MKQAVPESVYRHAHGAHIVGEHIWRSFNDYYDRATDGVLRQSDSANERALYQYMMQRNNAAMERHFLTVGSTYKRTVSEYVLHTVRERGVPEPEYIQNPYDPSFPLSRKDATTLYVTASWSIPYYKDERFFAGGSTNVTREIQIGLNQVLIWLCAGGKIYEALHRVCTLFNSEASTEGRGILYAKDANAALRIYMMTVFHNTMQQYVWSDAPMDWQNPLILHEFLQQLNNHQMMQDIVQGLFTSAQE